MSKRKLYIFNLNDEEKPAAEMIGLKTTKLYPSNTELVDAVNRVWLVNFEEDFGRNTITNLS
jgi:hypothetical protein